MSEAPTWEQFRMMLDALSKTNEKLHEQLHPLYEQVGQHKDELGREVQEWPGIEPAWLNLVGEMQTIINSHLQSSRLQCAAPLTVVGATPAGRKTAGKGSAGKKG